MTTASVPTTETCPTCEKEGHKVRLDLEVVSNTFSCPKGHTFNENLIAQAALQAADEKSALDQIPEEATAQPEIVPEAPGTLEILPQSSPLPEMAPPPVMAPQAHEAIPAKPVSSVEAKIEGPAPGGDVWVRVRIPELHASGLAAEAEIQGQTIEEFFQRQLEFAFENHWMY